MKNAWKWMIAVVAVMMAGIVYVGLNNTIASAADEYTVTYYDIVNNQTIGSNTYDTGETLDFNYSDTGTSSGTLTPVGQQIAFFVDTDNKMCHEVGTSTQCNTTNFSTTSPTVYVVLTGNSDRVNTAASGVSWVLDEGNLYVIGSGTYTPNTTNTAESRDATISATESFTFPISTVSVMYGDLSDGGTYGVNAPSVGQEKTLSGTFYEYTAPSESTWTLDSDVYARGSQTIATHYSGCYTAISWSDAASSVTTAYIGDDVKLSDNCSFLFNGLVGGATGRTSIPASTYSNLTTVYFYADTADVTSAAAMFARCHNLINIYVNEEKDFKKCKDTAYMFFADSKLTNGTDSLVDNMNLTGSAVLLDTAYMYAGCSEITTPNVKDFVMTAVTSAEGMFYGCEKAGLTFSDSTSPSYVGGWNMSALQDGMFMFMGRDLGVDSTTVLSSTNIPFMANLNPGYGTLSDSQVGSVVNGAADLSKWGSLANLKTAAYMFAQNDSVTSCSFGSTYTALEDISDMFLRCDNLATVNMLSVSMPALTAAQHTFTMCGGSAGNGKVNMSLTAPNLTNIAFMFYGSTFSDISITGSNLAGITEATAAFANCENLATVKASDQQFPALEHARFMFFGDDSLSTLQVSSWNMGACTDASFMFMDDALLTSLDTSSWNIGNASCNMENFAYNCGASAIDLSNAGANITNIAFAFAKMPNLTAFTAPSDMTSCVNAFGAWSNDEKLTGTISLPSSRAVDLRGMFYSDSALTTSGLTVGSFISSPATFLSYAFAGCDGTEFTSLDLSGAVTRNALYMDCLCDGDTYLTNVTVGSGVTPSAAITIAASFRGCDLTDTGASNIIGAFSDSDTVTDMYALFEGNDDVTTMDLSGMDFSAASDMSRFAYACDKLGVITEEQALTVPSSSLAKITIPTTFTSAVTDSSKGENIFYVDKKDSATLDASDPSDDVVTYLDVSGTALPAYLGSYSWTGDNRMFTALKSKTINGNDVSSHVFPSTTADDALLAVDGVSTLTLNGTKDDLTFAWSVTDGSGNKSILSETDNDYSAPASTYAGGVYTVTSSFYPSSLSTAFAANKLKATDADFLLGADVTSITATYNGSDVTVSEDYKKDDVTVKAVLANGDQITLSSDDWTASSTKVTKKGANTYTATYKDGNGKEHTASYTVNGLRNIGFIVSTYTGPAILVGSNYDTKDVTTMAYYADDTSRSEGFEVTPEYSSLKVTTVGDNTFKATYIDKNNNNKELSSSFVVTGYKTISRIDATYAGDSILVGNKYNKEDVVVKVYYADGSGSFTTTDFSVSSLSVSYEGSNTYTATYRDPYGNIFTDTFTVTGYKGSSSSSTTATTSPYAAVSSIYGNGTTTLPSTGTLVSSTGGGVAEDGSVATSTGVVQTGTTGRYVGWGIMIIALLGGSVALVIYRKRINRNEEQ